MANYNTSSSSSTRSRNVHKYITKALKAVMKSQRVHLPKHDLPIRLRPWFLVFTCVIMLLLALLGFTNFSHALPFNDKFLHFTCFCIATGVFYFIFDVEEDARRVWFWRHAGLIFTAVTCFFFGGLVSEIVQSMLPYKEFDPGDVVANVLGSTIGLYTSYHLEKYYRARREIARLYRPLDTEDTSDVDDYSDDDGPSATQLLPLHNSRPARGPSKTVHSSRSKAYKADRLRDVWDEGEDLFGIGDDDSDFEDGTDTPRPSHQPGSQSDEHPQSSPPPPPKITITRS